MKGDIQVVRGNFPRKSAATVRLQGYTKAFALNRDRKTRSFKTNKSYSDIANLIAGENGLGADIDDTCTKHEYIFQRNQTDFEFLLELAEKVGYEVVTLRWDAAGAVHQRPFISGFERDEQVIGRPVDLVQGPDGALYVSDDMAGAIYRVGGAALVEYR